MYHSNAEYFWFIICLREGKVESFTYPVQFSSVFLQMPQVSANYFALLDLMMKKTLTGRNLIKVRGSILTIFITVNSVILVAICVWLSFFFFLFF